MVSHPRQKAVFTSVLITLKLHFEPRLIDLHVDQKALDKAMEEFKESAALTDDEADALNKKSAMMSAFLKSPERVAKIVEDIAKHFKEKVQPHELKAMIVTPDREACVKYKEELDKYFKKEASRVVITTSPNDDLEFKISTIDLLAELIDKEVRNIFLRLDINDVSEDFTNNILDLVNQNSGKHSLFLSLIDPINKYEVDLLSRKTRVNLDKDFMAQIDSFKNIKIRVE